MAVYYANTSFLLVKTNLFLAMNLFTVPRTFPEKLCPVPLSVVPGLVSEALGEGKKGSRQLLGLGLTAPGCSDGDVGRLQ